MRIKPGKVENFLLKKKNVLCICGHPVFPAIYVEKIIFATLKDLGIPVEN